MALFKRRTRQTDELKPVDSSQRPGWARRLSIVGQSLDTIPHPIRDVVVVTEGNPGEDGALISLLGYRESAYHAGWTSIMYSWSTSVAESQLDHQLAPGTPVHSGYTQASSHGEWEIRLRSVGSLLDRSGTPLRSVTVIDLITGVLVNAIVPVTDPVPGWELRSIELSNDRILFESNQLGAHVSAAASR